MMRWLVVLLMLLPSLHARAEGVVSTSNFFFHTAAPSCNYAFPVSPPWSVGGNAYATCVKGLTTCTGTAYLNSNGCVLLSTAQGSACNDPSPNGICPSNVVSCPANSTGTTTCTCNAGYQPNVGATACVLIPIVCNTPVDTVVSSGFYDLGTSDASTMPASICSGSCTVNFTGTGSAVARSLVGGVFHYYAEGVQTSSGAPCSPETTNAPVSSAGVPASTCGTGQSVGWINGTPVCYTTQPDSPTATPPPVKSTSTSTTNIDASSNVVNTTAITNNNGSTITTVTTTAPDGTVSTEITNTAANPIASAAFCAEFPSDPSCAPQSDCDLNPDAIGCLDAGTPGDTLALGTQSISVGITPINFGIAAGCPADRQITVWGGGVVPIPLDDVCNFATMIKPLVLAMAWLAAGFIVFGSFKQG